MEQKTEFIKHTFGSQIHRLMPTLIGDPDHTCALLQIFAKAKKHQKPEIGMFFAISCFSMLKHILDSRDTLKRNKKRDTVLATAR